MWFISEALDQVWFFLERGGSVLLVIMVAVLAMWAMIIERLMFLTKGSKSLEEAMIGLWDARNERKSWHAHQIRLAMLSESRSRLYRFLPLIKTLVALCPLFGLLGTVTGMIEVFDVMAMVGNSSPKAMASGISKATIPTMGGMVGALSGVFAISILQRMAERRQNQIEEHLTFDH